MIDTYKLHIDNDYFMKLSNNIEKNICVADMPTNYFTGSPQMTSIYELENEKVTIYRNKQKFLTRACPNYAKRTMVWAHLLKLLSVRGMYDIPIQVTDNGKILTEYKNLNTILPLFALLEEPELNKDVELEVKLMIAITDYMDSNIEPPKDVLDGFVACSNIFNGD